MKNLKHFVLLLLMLLTCAVQAWADPPSRVGRISYVQGSVTFRDLASDNSEPASINWPVTSNTMITTSDGSRAELRVGSTAVQLDGNTELEITRLDDDGMTLRLNQGTAIAHVRDSRLADGFELDTPQGGSVRLYEPSKIRIQIDGNGSSVQVFSGRARYDDADSGLTISSGHLAEISQGNVHMADAAGYSDSFEEWSMAREQREDAPTAAHYVSPDLTGYEELDRYGDWQVTAEYGTLWYPRAVPAGWAPYRVGRWVWVEPWGWTWVDNAPWGYAPSHYGRWVWYGHRWCWAPGIRVAQPVWAPAMVGWVGGNGWNASFSAGSAPAVGWFPLAPHEVYVPSYPVSPTYIQQVNVTHVTNINNITYINGRPTVPTQVNYRNRALPNAVTVLPRDRFLGNSNVPVTVNPAHSGMTRTWQSAPVSATVPVAIAPHPEGNQYVRSHFGDERRNSDPYRSAPPAAVSTMGTPLEVHTVRPQVSAQPAAIPQRMPSAVIPRPMPPQNLQERDPARFQAPVPVYERHDPTPAIHQDMPGSHRPDMPGYQAQPNAFPHEAPQAPIYRESRGRSTVESTHEEHGFASPATAGQPRMTEQPHPQGMPEARVAPAPRAPESRHEKENTRPHEEGHHHNHDNGAGY